MWTRKDSSPQASEDSLVVKAALPGVKPEEVDISVTGDTPTIKGETKAEEAKPKTIKIKARPVIEGKS